MIRLICLFVGLIQPACLAAETISVRSGNHEGFARLLIDHDLAAQWTFGRVDGGFEFRPVRSDLDYDLSSVFDLIPRNRIADVVDLGGGRLFIELACDCHGDAFDLRRGQVVLDIKDGANPIPGSPFESLLDPVTASTVDRSEQAPRPPFASLPRVESPERTWVPVVPARTASEQPGPLDFTLRALTQPETWPESPLPARPEDLTPREKPEPAESSTGIPEPAKPADRVAEVQQTLLEQIARAASQGLLEADLPEPAPTVQPPSDSPPPSGPGRPGETVEIPSIGSRDHVAITTGVDRANPANSPPLRITDDGAPCLPPEFFDIAGWGDSSGAPSGDFGTYRARMLGEFDLANGEGLTELARYYLFMTFGAEAKALVGRYPTDLARGDLISMMADVIDHGFSSAAPSLVKQMACDGPTALWAVLAQPVLFPGHSINLTAVTGSFAALPPHLQRHFGPGLTERFLTIGDTRTADLIRNATIRGSGDTPSNSVMSARLDVANGDIGRALAGFDEVIESADIAMPEALLDRVETTLASGWTVSGDLISLLESLAFERRGQPAALAFIDAAVRAHAAGQDFEQAYARLSEYKAASGASPSRTEALSIEVFSAVLADATDAAFLELIVPRLEDAAELPPDLRRGLAKRFIDLGLPTPARPLLTGEGVVPAPEDRILFARAALIEGRPDVAIGYLAGIEDDESRSIRARALEQAGDFSGALREYQRTGDRTALSTVAWRGGIWPDVGNDAGDHFSAAARAMASGPAPVPAATSLTPLAEIGELLSTSRAARSMIDDLLEKTAVPSTGAEF